jgi:hypothetical protein
VVLPRWVELVASISDGPVELLARRWLASLAGEHPDAAMYEEELGRGLRDLIDVCRKAADHEKDVVFVWT